MRYPYRDTITIYILTNGKAVKRTVTSTFVAKSSATESICEAQVYIPLHAGRRVRYVKPSDFSQNNTSMFTISVGDKAIIGICDDADAPDDAYTVSEISYHLSGSKRLHHIKLKLYCNNITSKEENTNEAADN